MARDESSILACSQEDLNFKAAVKEVSDDILLSCLSKETRKGAIRQLEREAMCRGLKIPQK